MECSMRLSNIQTVLHLPKEQTVGVLWIMMCGNIGFSFCYFFARYKSWWQVPLCLGRGHQKQKLALPVYILGSLSFCLHCLLSLILSLFSLYLHAFTHFYLPVSLCLFLWICRFASTSDKLFPCLREHWSQTPFASLQVLSWCFMPQDTCV